MSVRVGGTAVTIGSMGVAVGGTGVAGAVGGGTAVDVGRTVGAAGPQPVTSSTSAIFTINVTTVDHCPICAAMFCSALTGLGQPICKKPINASDASIIGYRSQAFFR